MVAITKCDTEGANPAKVKTELQIMGLPIEDAGGTVQVVEVSAFTGAGLEDLELALFLEVRSVETCVPPHYSSD